MEGAPLSLAYAHARNAIVETQKANPIAASEEHDLAAGEFANAAHQTGDPEALRTLQLLEQHHQKLAELLKFKPRSPIHGDDGDEELSVYKDGALSTVIEEGGIDSSEKPKQASLRHKGSHGSPTVDSRHRRDPASSIASNLASARGIQSNQNKRGLQSAPTSSVTSHNAESRLINNAAENGAAAGRNSARSYDRRTQDPNSLKSPVRNPGSNRQSRTPGHDQVANIPPSIGQPGSDDAFTRFYSTVESLGTRLSAALAFTGLPLSSADPEISDHRLHTPEKPAPSLPRDKSRTTPSGSPDVSRFFSRAALTAVREEAGGAGVAESFYVVPTSGGTVSYAGMLQAQRQSSGLSETAAEDEFVDASEMPMRGSFEGNGTGVSRNSRNRAASQKSRPSPKKDDRDRTDVERELEYWKKLAKDKDERLRAFEMNAQRESIMAASMFRGGGARSRHHSPESVRGQPGVSSAAPGVPKIPSAFQRSASSGIGGATGTGGDEVRDQKIGDLEDEIQQAKEDLRKCQKENRKLMAVVEKYRKRFEDLKENARERLRAQEQQQQQQYQQQGTQVQTQAQAQARTRLARDNESARKDQLLE